MNKLDAKRDDILNIVDESKMVFSSLVVSTCATCPTCIWQIVDAIKFSN